MSKFTSDKKLQINICSFNELRDLPKVGKAIAYKIWELRQAGDITPERLASIPHIQYEQIKNLIDYTTSKEHVDSIVETEEDGQQMLTQQHTVLQDLAVAEAYLNKGAEILNRSKGPKVDMTERDLVESEDEKMSIAAAKPVLDNAVGIGTRKKVTFIEAPTMTSTPILQTSHKPQ